MAKGVDLSNPNVGKTLFKLAVPAIFAQLSTMLYNVVDRVYIGQMPDGALAMAGIGITMPIAMLISAFSVFVGMGGAPLAAISMGKNDYDKAEKILGNSLSMLIFISITLMAIFTVFREPILWQFGASGATIEYASSYLQIYLLGTIFTQLTLGLNPFINTQGYTKIGMITVVIGTLTNVILDPVFIFGFNMGVRGAAIATVISQVFSSIWVLQFLFGKKTMLKITKHNLKPEKKIVLEILSLGISPFTIQSMESLIIISFNRQLFRFGGDASVAVLTIMNSLMQVTLLPIVGVCRGAQPILGYNFGAKNLENVKNTLKIQFACCIGYTAFFTAVFMLIPQVFVRIFSNDLALIGATSAAIRIYLSGQLIIGAQIACQQSFIALGQAKQSMIIVVLRKVVLLIPLIYIFPMIFTANKLHAVLLAQPITDIISTLVAVVCFALFYRKELAKSNISI